MVPKAWTLSCNYELKSPATGPRFFLIYLNVKKILHPKFITHIPIVNLTHLGLEYKIVCIITQLLLALSTHIVDVCCVYTKREKINFYDAFAVWLFKICNELVYPNSLMDI